MRGDIQKIKSCASDLWYTQIFVQDFDWFVLEYGVQSAPVLWETFCLCEKVVNVILLLRSHNVALINLFGNKLKSSQENSLNIEHHLQILFLLWKISPELLRLDRLDLQLT